MNTFDAQIDILCHELKMPGVRKAHSSLAREAVDQGLHPSQFLLACLSQELQSRRESRLKTRLTQPVFRLKPAKTAQDDAVDARKPRKIGLGTSKTQM